MTLAKMVWSTGIWVDLYQGILFVAQVMLFSFFCRKNRQGPNREVWRGTTAWHDFQMKSQPRCRISVCFRLGQFFFDCLVFFETFCELSTSQTQKNSGRKRLESAFHTSDLFTGFYRHWPHSCFIIVCHAKHMKLRYFAIVLLKISIFPGFTFMIPLPAASSWNT